MRIATYARVSTRGQSLEPQVDALRAYGERRGAEALEYRTTDGPGPTPPGPGSTP